MSKEIRHIYFYKHDLALSIALYIWHFEWQLVLLYLSPWREENVKLYRDCVFNKY